MRAAALWEGPARFGRNRESRSREVRFLHPGYGTAGVGILPKQRPSKCVAEKEKCSASVQGVCGGGGGLAWVRYTVL